MLLLFSTGMFLLKIFADSITTSVTVGNSAPTITAGPAESAESSSTSPTNVGASVTFQATATDSNAENYYLIVCSSDSVTPHNGAAPTCGATQWCVSTSTTSGSQASCSRTALIGDAESNAWYAFVCDGNASAANCTATGNQGSGGTGSPFAVNHAPAFSSVSNDGPKNPGQTVTWITTSSDSDTSGSADTVKLLVCKTTGISADACDGGAGDTWCSSSASASNPTCGYSVPIPTVDGASSAYVYIVDSHNFGSAAANQGSDSAYTVSNVAPVVSSVTINGGNDIDLTEGTTTDVVVTATVTDNNSCGGGELVTTYGYVYRSGKGYSLCDSAGEADSNFCYPEISCSVSGGSCTGTSDPSANYTCTVSMQYYSDPTDVATQFPTETWLSNFKAVDDDSGSNNLEVATGIVVNSLTALDVTSAVNYGALDVGEKNDPLDQITTITPTGNVGLDEELSGTDMCTDSPTCSGGVIGVTYQKYALASLTAYASGTALSGVATEAELNLQKATSGTPTTKNTWWGILIPTGTIPGVYSGSNTITAVKGEVINW